MPDEPKIDGRIRNGGPRFKVRPDDQRGSPPGAALQPEYEPNDADRELVRTYTVLVGRKLLARRLGIGVDTLDKYYGDVMNEEIFKAAALNGGKIWQRALRGDAGAQYYFQRMRGGWGQKDDFASAETAKPEGEAFAVPPEVLAELSDEEFELYERLCDRVLGRASGVSDRSEGADRGEGDQGEAAG